MEQEILTLDLSSSFDYASWLHHKGEDNSWFGKVVTPTSPAITIQCTNMSEDPIGYTTMGYRVPWLKAGFTYTISVPDDYRILSYSLTTQSTSSLFTNTFHYTSAYGMSESSAQQVNVNNTISAENLSTTSVQIKVNGNAAGYNFGILLINLYIICEKQKSHKVFASEYISEMSGYPSCAHLSPPFLAGVLSLMNSSVSYLGAFNSLDDAINMASNVEFAGNRSVRMMVFGYFDSKLRTGVIFQSFSGNVCSQLLLLSSGMKQRNITFVDATLDVVSKKESFA